MCEARLMTWWWLLIHSYSYSFTPLFSHLFIHLLTFLVYIFTHICSFTFIHQHCRCCGVNSNWIRHSNSFTRLSLMNKLISWLVCRFTHLLICFVYLMTWNRIAGVKPTSYIANYRPGRRRRKGRYQTAPSMTLTAHTHIHTCTQPLDIPLVILPAPFPLIAKITEQIWVASFWRPSPICIDPIS